MTLLAEELRPAAELLLSFYYCYLSWYRVYRIETGPEAAVAPGWDIFGYVTLQLSPRVILSVISSLVYSSRN